MIECVLETSVALIHRELRKNPLTSIAAWLLKPAFASIRHETNYEEAGGAPLLGVDGNVIISHGISSALAIRNAIRVAGELVTTRVNAQIVEAITPYLHHSVPASPPAERKS